MKRQSVKHKNKNKIDTLPKTFLAFQKEIILKRIFREFFWKSLESVRIKYMTNREFHSIEDKASDLSEIK